jgi:hypothetical protein
MYYTLGRGRGGNIYVYGLKLKQFVFSNEIVRVGVSEIDSQIRNYYSRNSITLESGGTGTFVNDEIVYQGSSLENATAQALVYDFIPNSSIQLYRMIGSFIPGAVLKGATSNAQWTVGTTSEIVTMDNAFEDVQDNNRFKTESNSIIDFTEKNPFGEP